MVFWAGFLRLLSPHLQSLPSPSRCYTHFSSDHAFSLQRLCICCLLCLEISPPRYPRDLLPDLFQVYFNVIFLLKLFLDTLCNILHPPVIFPILLPYVIFFSFWGCTTIEGNISILDYVTQKCMLHYSRFLVSFSHCCVSRSFNNAWHILDA